MAQKYPRTKTQKQSEGSESSTGTIVLIVVFFVAIILIGGYFFLKQFSDLSTKIAEVSKDKKTVTNGNDKDKDTNNVGNNNNNNNSNNGTGSSIPDTGNLPSTSDPDKKDSGNTNNDDTPDDNSDSGDDFFSNTPIGGGGSTTNSTFNSTLKTNQKLYPSQFLLSPNGKYQFILQSDGKLLLLESGSKEIWSAATYTVGFTPKHLIIQGDRNLVLYDINNKSQWSSRTSNTQGSNPYIEVIDDGDVIIYVNDKNILWMASQELLARFSRPSASPQKNSERPWQAFPGWTNTDQKWKPGQYLMSSNKLHQFIFTKEGSLELRNYGKTVWSFVPTNIPLDTCTLNFQSDKNFVLYTTDDPNTRSILWSSVTHSKRGSQGFFRVRDDGPAMITNEYNDELWIAKV